MSEPLSVSDINQLRMLVKKGYAKPAQTAEQRRAAQYTRREAFRAAALSFAQQAWDRERARLEAKMPGCLFEFVIGLRPRTYTHQQQAIYRTHLNKLPIGETYEGED